MRLRWSSLQRGNEIANWKKEKEKKIREINKEDR